MFLSKPMIGTQLDWSNPLNKDVVLDLLMNEGHGDIVHDLSGYGNHGVLHGFDFPSTRTSGWNPGLDGVALVFDGIDDYVQSPCALGAAGTIEFSFTPYSIWNSSSDQKSMIEMNDGRNAIRLETDGTIMFIISPSTGNLSILKTISTSWNPYTLYNLVFTWDGDYQKVYINGSLDNSITQTQSGGWGAELLIGGKTGTLYGDLTLNMFRILPHAKSAFEVMQTQINPYGVYL